MTLGGIRDALVAQLHNNWAVPGVPVFYENTQEVDLCNVGDYFIRCSVLFDGSEQANIAYVPFERVHGTLVLSVFAKKTLGTKKALEYAETLRTLFRFKNLGGVHTQESGPKGMVSSGGWASYDLRIPFYSDSNS